MKDWQLSRRILFLALAPVCTITLLLTMMVMLVGVTEIDGALHARGALIVRHLAPACEYGVFSGNRTVLEGLAQAVMREEDAKAVIITDNEHHILAYGGKPETLRSEYIQAALQGKVLKGKHSNLIFGAPVYQGKPEDEEYDLFDRSSQVTAAQPKLMGYVHLELSTEASKHSKAIFMLSTLLIGIIGTAAASILALGMSRDLSRPLSRLINGVHRMAKGELSVRIPAASGGELQQLENGFNLMAEEIQSSHDKLLEINANLEKMIADRTRELEQKNQALEHLSNTDRLTGLYNRFKLENILEEEHLRCQRYGGNFAIAIVDVDKFKLVNDTYGHQTGDQVLIGIAEILRNHVRSLDAVGRWGGEEFLVIFRETASYGAVSIAEKLRHAIMEYDFGEAGKITASFGVTAYRYPDSILEMMIRADNALYHAKRGGRNRVEFKDF